MRVAVVSMLIVIASAATSALPRPDVQGAKRATDGMWLMRPFDPQTGQTFSVIPGPATFAHAADSAKAKRRSRRHRARRGANHQPEILRPGRSGTAQARLPPQPPGQLPGKTGWLK